MANRSILVIDLLELLRLLRAGESERTIARLLRHNRRTVHRYCRWASQQGLLTGELPTLDRLQQLVRATFPEVVPPQQTSSVAAYADEIAALRERGLEVAAIRTRLEERHGVSLSYSAIWRLVQRQEPRTPEVVVRVEVAPGSEAQVDFGYAGQHLDPATGKLRKAWVFVLVLSWSRRHLYAEVVFDQRVETWLLCHAHAVAAFGGVPERIVPDNLKAAIVQASFTNPVVQRAYRECAEHYGFRIGPTPPRTPQHKGKVESGVHYVKRNFLAGRDPMPLDELNRALRRWTQDIAGQRLRGTTHARPSNGSARSSGRRSCRSRRASMTRRSGSTACSAGMAT